MHEIRSSFCFQLLECLTPLFPSQAPRRTDVVRRLRNGIVLNMVGLAATLLGAQATVGLLVAKALTSQSQPYLANTPQGFSPVLALDVFLVQVRC